MDGLRVHCPDCGAEIDEENLRCPSCERTFTKEDIERLHEEEVLQGWLLGNATVMEWEEEAEEGDGEEMDALQRWLSGDDSALLQWLGEVESGERSLTEEELLAVRGELASRTEEIMRREEEVERLRQELITLLEKATEGEVDVVDIVSRQEELTRRIAALEAENKRLKAEISRISSIMEVLKKAVGDLPEAELVVRLGEVLGERERLRAELESLRKAYDELKVELEKGLESLPEEIRDIKEKEIELKEKEIELESLREELRMKEESLNALRNQIEEGLIAAAPAAAAEGEVVTVTISDDEARRRIEELEAEVERLRAELKEKDEIIKKGGIVDQDTAKLLERITELEEELVEKNRLISEMGNELRIKEDELKRLRDTLKFKEEELNAREQDLMFRERKLQEEIRRLEAAKMEMGGLKEAQLKAKLEELQEEIKRKEEELRVKLKYLEAKERELKAKERGLVEEELSLMEEEIKLELKQEKVKTGTRRLDDLLYGGFPMGSNILIYGPPYCGKEVLIYSFIAEGLKKGVPAIIVLTDKTIDDIREDMKFVLPTYDQYEMMGLVRYVDAYSRSIGDTTTIDGVKYIDSQTDTEGIMNAVDEVARELKETAPYYRLIFISVSTLLAYLDPAVLLKFLQPFTTKRKRDRAVSLYLVHAGMHRESDIQTLGYTMDGTIEFKIENQKTYLCVKGITEAQSRNWIEVTVSKSGVLLGSFTLGHIR